MQLIRIFILKCFLFSLLSIVNCYLESDIRLDWKPNEQIKFYPKKNGKNQILNNENLNRNEFDRKELKFQKLNPFLSSNLIDHDDLLNNEFLKLDKKLNEFYNNDLKINLKDNKLLNDQSDEINNQNLIWFLIAKIIPTTNKLNHFLCNANQSTQQLCTSFNHLHLLVGKNKRNQHKDDIFNKIKLIENLSNEFNDEFNKFSKRNLNRKSDKRFTNQNLDQNNFNKQSTYLLNPYLKELLNSKSIYKHHQRLKRTIENLTSQLNQTSNHHNLSKRSLDNEINYSNVQYGEFFCFFNFIYFVFDLNS